MKIFIGVLWQSLVLSVQELRGSKLRSFLSLLGITIGILCIISVRTAVNSLEMNISDSFSRFGNDVLYVQKWPWIFTEDYPWWKYINRPQVKIREQEQLSERLTNAEACAMIYYAGQHETSFRDRVIEGVSISAVTKDYDKIKNLEFTSGRYMTAHEFQTGAPVCVLGASVAATLAEGRGEIVGKEIRSSGRKFKVVGVLKKEGDDLFGFSLDGTALITYKYVSNNFDIERPGEDPLIAAVPKKGVSVDELKYEIEGAMRSIRRLPPTREANFSINRMSVFTEGIKSYLNIVSFAGWFIGLFSIIVGGFGIANIMFVSVKERTYIIGLKKAVGAHKRYILMEFLLESVVLCILGGLIGLLIVFALFKGLGMLMSDSNFRFHITAANIAIGLLLSAGIGIVAGFVPAWTAANMRPVDALRS